MSARKRHTEVLDFMRTFIVAERTGHWDNLYGSGYGEMVRKLLKRGWLEQERGPAHAFGSWRPIMQRHNSLRSTALGRRAIYRVDRHANPRIRAHSWGTSHGYRVSPQVDASMKERIIRNLTATSARARDLHGKRPLA